VNFVEKFYAVAKISQIYLSDILLWATLYVHDDETSKVFGMDQTQIALKIPETQ